MNNTQLSKEMYDLKHDVVRVFSLKFGERLTYRAAGHIDEAMGRANSWEKLYRILEAKRGEGRSHALALQMLSAYVAILNEEVIPKLKKRKKRED